MPQLIPLVFLAVSAHIFSRGVSGLINGANKLPTTPGQVTPASAPPNPMDIKPVLAGALPCLFGSRRIGGDVIFSYRTGTKTHYVIAIAGAPLSKIVGVYINNVLVNVDTSNRVTSAPWTYTHSAAGVTTTYYAVNVRIYDGTQTAADPVLLAGVPGWRSDMIGTNIAYAAVTVDTNAWTFAQTGGLSQSSDVFSNALPDFTFWCLGFKCYDPRDGSQVLGTPSTWKWSGTPSIIEANYRVHQLGMQVPTSRIDWASVGTAATLDETLVATKSGATEYRYQCALYWRTDERHEAVCARIAAAHDGGMSLIGTVWTCRTGVWPSPVAALTSDDYVNNGLSIADCVPINSTANGVRGKYASAPANFEARDFPAYQDAAALAQDGTPIWLDVDLQTVSSASQAQRLARIAYNRRRLGRAATGTVLPKWVALTAGDTITMTDALASISGESFRVLARTLHPDFSVELQLQSESAATYAWTAATDETAIATYPTIGGIATFLPAPGFILFDGNGAVGTVVPEINVLLPTGGDFDTWRLYSHDGTSTAYSVSAFLILTAAITVATGTIGMRVENSISGRVSQTTFVTFSRATLDTVNGTVGNTNLTVGTGNWQLAAVQDPFIVLAAAGVATLQLFGSPAFTGSVSMPNESLALVWSSTPDAAAALAAAAAGGSNVTFYSNATQQITQTAAPGTVRYYWVVQSPTNTVASWGSTGALGVSPRSKETNGLAVVF